MLPLKLFKNKQKGLPDLLNYAAVIDDGIILNKDGSLMASWFYRGIDTASATDNERNHVSTRLNNVLAKLGSGWMTHHDVIRWQARGYPACSESHFADAITRLIDNERRGQFNAKGQHYESVYILTLTFLPPLHRQSQLKQWMFTNELADQKTAVASSLLEQFKTTIHEIEDGLSSVLKLQRLKGQVYSDEQGLTHINEQLLQFLNYCLTGNNHYINLPPVPMYIDAIIGGQDFYASLSPKIGNKFISVIAIDGFPQESAPGILSLLEQLPISYRWSTRFIYMDSVEALLHLKKYRRKWQQKVRGFMDQILRTSKGVVDQDAQLMVSDTDAAIAEAASSLVAYGYYTSVIVLLDENPSYLLEQARYVRRVIQQLGFDCRLETVNAVEAWLGSLPGHALPNIRRPLLHTLNLADLLPTSAIWPGEEYNPCPYYPPQSPALLHAATDGSTPFRFNLHIHDVGHTLIFGPTGAGKSTLLALIAAQFCRYQGANIFAFDKGNSLFALTKAVQGQHYDIGGEASLYFCPLANLQSDYDQSWAEQWIEQLIILQGVSVLPEHRNAIHQAMRLLRHTTSTTLSDFVTNLQDKSLRAALQYYTIDGAMGRLLDNEQDGLAFGNFQTFEIEALMNLGDKALIPVLLYLFHRIEKRLCGQPTLLILDEAWLMLSHPVFRDKIREWLKVLRKSNCAVVLATQSLSDATRSGIVDVLNESCPTKIFLPNANALEQGSREFYEQMGLNERQIQLIAHATPKRHYYYLSPQGKRLFELNLGPVALAFVGAAGKEDLQMIQTLLLEHPVDWPWQWLDYRRVAYSQYLNGNEE